MEENIDNSEEVTKDKMHLDKLTQEDIDAFNNAGIWLNAEEVKREIERIERLKHEG
jgi:hypothetical protein